MDGSDRDHPIQLENVDLQDFKLFFRVAVASEYVLLLSDEEDPHYECTLHRVLDLPLPTLSCEDWITVQKLAWRLDMKPMLQETLSAIMAQFGKEDEAAELLWLGLNYWWPSEDAKELITFAINKLVKREGPLQETDIRRLGVLLSSKISRSREKHIRMCANDHYSKIVSLLPNLSQGSTQGASQSMSAVEGIRALGQPFPTQPFPTYISAHSINTLIQICDNTKVTYVLQHLLLVYSFNHRAQSWRRCLQRRGGLPILITITNGRFLGISRRSKPSS
jgi:hypothetical protein